MSMTFSIEGAPTERITPYPDEPDYEVDVPVAPFTEINLSNGNAADILRLIDPDTEFDYCGEWAGSKLVAINASVKHLLETTGKNVLVTSTVREGNMVFCGRSDEYVQRRLEQFLQLTNVAIEHGRRVFFG